MGFGAGAAMPELPDVAAMKRYLDATSLHQHVADVWVGRDYVLKGTGPERLREALAGRAFESSTRHGKNLLIETDGEPWLRLHFGMTGNLKYFKQLEDEPGHVRVRFAFGNGYHLAYDCQRMLGRVSLEDGPAEFVEAHDLGPDALSVSRDEFERIMSGRRGGLKRTLMNQHIIAGLGNVYVDEVLFQARLHPETTIDRLSDEELKGLYEAIRQVLKTSIERGSDARDLPSDYLIHHRGEGEPCPRCSAEIRRIKTGQRSTYFCPECQPRRD